jgi:hypothetical protein
MTCLSWHKAHSVTAVLFGSSVVEIKYGHGTHSLWSKVGS